MLITQDDENFISSFFPELKFIHDNERLFLKGKLSFIVSFDKYTKKYQILKSKYPTPKGVLIEDNYKIEIDLSAENVYRHVKEIGNKIDKLPDLHKFPNNYLCIAGYFDEDQNIDFITFFCEIVIPFFYDESHFKKYGIWPRPGFSHGILGLLENYYQAIIRPKSNKQQLTLKCIEEMRQMADKDYKVELNNFLKRFIQLLIKRKELTLINRNLQPARQLLNEIVSIISQATITDSTLCIFCRPRHCSGLLKSSHVDAFKGLKCLHEKIRQFDIKLNI